MDHLLTDNPLPESKMTIGTWATNFSKIPMGKISVKIQMFSSGIMHQKELSVLGGHICFSALELNEEPDIMFVDIFASWGRH